MKCAPFKSKCEWPYSTLIADHAVPPSPTRRVAIVQDSPVTYSPFTYGMCTHVLAQAWPDLYDDLALGLLLSDVLRGKTCYALHCTHERLSTNTSPRGSAKYTDGVLGKIKAPAGALNTQAEF